MLKLCQSIPTSGVDRLIIIDDPELWSVAAPAVTSFPVGSTCDAPAAGGNALSPTAQ
jgi:hypothetical protein